MFREAGVESRRRGPPGSLSTSCVLALALRSSSQIIGRVHRFFVTGWHRLRFTFVSLLFHPGFLPRLFCVLAHSTLHRGCCTTYAVSGHMRIEARPEHFDVASRWPKALCGSVVCQARSTINVLFHTSVIAHSNSSGHMLTAKCRRFMMKQ